MPTVLQGKQLVKLKYCSYQFLPCGAAHNKGICEHIGVEIIDIFQEICHGDINAYYAHIGRGRAVIEHRVG